MATKDYEGRKFNEEGVNKIVDSLTEEQALQIKINDTAFTISMRTPGEDVNLIRGLLHSEGIINDRKFIPDFSFEKQEKMQAQTIVNVVIPKEKLGLSYSNSRSLLSVSSCGICGKTSLEDIEGRDNKIGDKNKIDINLIHQLFQQMQTQQHDFQQSGGTHAAAAFCINGKMLCSMEDIGRHNAVDKVIGKLIFENQLKEAKIITVSGRISYEIVIKCFKAGIPFLAAVSAPSSLAVDYAKELGITLFAFCRGSRATCYSNPHRTKATNTHRNVN